MSAEEPNRFVTNFKLVNKSTATASTSSSQQQQPPGTAVSGRPTYQAPTRERPAFNPAFKWVKGSNRGRSQSPQTSSSTTGGRVVGLTVASDASTSSCDEDNQQQRGTSGGIVDFRLAQGGPKTFPSKRPRFAAIDGQSSTAYGQRSTASKELWSMHKIRSAFIDSSSVTFSDSEAHKRPSSVVRERRNSHSAESTDFIKTSSTQRTHHSTIAPTGNSSKVAGTAVVRRMLLKHASHRRRRQQNLLKFRRASHDHTSAPKLRPAEFCMRYNRTGMCPRPGLCPLRHDKAYLAICKNFLTGTCPLSDSTCRLSHRPNVCNMPICDQFLAERCFDDQCLYIHVKHSPNTAICQAFVLGFCGRGLECRKQHVFAKHFYSNFGRPTIQPKLPTYSKLKSVNPSDEPSETSVAFNLDKFRTSDSAVETPGFLPNYIKVVD